MSISSIEGKFRWEEYVASEKMSLWCYSYFNMNVCNMNITQDNTKKIPVMSQKWQWKRVKTVLKIIGLSNQYERYITDQVSKILFLKNT